ncbi:hypothetical protein M153_20300012120 [Pseudoloma neurophilia]|uniref:Transposable element n=1 Tax=Pseudoloma neurophilia TaxID=146866 RepID=A0A0R0M4S2_9MICR|nr:hypothetical protein M153_20300012120 [Pseudoloma neurophilia]
MGSDLITDIVQKTKTYFVPFSREKLMKKELEDLIQNNIIETSVKNLCTMLHDRKIKWKSRLIINFRDINKITQEMQSYFPEVRDNFHRMIGSMYYARLILQKVY